MIESILFEVEGDRLTAKRFPVSIAVSGEFYARIRAGLVRCAQVCDDGAIVFDVANAEARYETLSPAALKDAGPLDTLPFQLVHYHSKGGA